MSPKPVTISIFLLILTVSSATDDCPGYKNVSDVLGAYGLPRGLFPKNVKHFKCGIMTAQGMSLSIQLDSPCTVDRTVVLIKNVLEFESEINATISYQKLTNVEGVTVKLYFAGQLFGEPMIVTGANILKCSFIPPMPPTKTLQFHASNGLSSPCFPIGFFPSKPPTCKPIPSDFFNYGFPLLLAA